MNDFQSLPTTRYLGSKRKLLPALKATFETLSFHTVADPFCGSGAVSYLLKSLGKQVVASDALKWNAICTEALLGNPDTSFLPVLNRLLENLDVDDVPAGFIETHFDGLFFKQQENRFIDCFVTEIANWQRPRRQYAYHALFQAALAKRPYNLFHRANLYMREREVARSFGNKTTWDTPFPVLIQRYAKELSNAHFVSEKTCSVMQRDVSESDFSNVDLVYLDPPYMPKRGMGVDYLDYYHLLEGISLEDNPKWERMLLHKYKHKPLEGRGDNPWCHANEITGSFDSVIDQCGSTQVVISYRSDGIPSVDTLVEFLKRCGKKVTIIDCGKYVYALSRNRKSREVILVGE